MDAFIGGQNAQSAYTAGLTTERERDQAFTGNAVQALFAVPITAAGAVVARVATRPAVAEALRIGRGFLPDTPVPSRFVLRGENTPELLRAIDGGGGYAYLDTLPSIAPARNPITGQLLEVTPSRPGEINIFSNRYITGLRDDRVVSLALERARDEVAQLYEQGIGAVLFHGSPSGYLISFGTTRGLGGLRPTGAMRAAGFEPRTGELLRGAGPDGINFDQLSTVTAADLPTALRYGRTFRDTPDADFLATLSRRERALFQEPFPVLYGLRPNPAQVRGYPRHDFGYYEHGIQGGVDFSQIRSIFVPQNRVGLVQQILRDAGLDRTIHVAPIDPIFRAVGG
ncbi:MAG: hypothetical protein HRT44_04150 [Bdellovibrionales bacterium]|nr:hypothetical protein [Bdellovibrionales bacterium]NQZ18435.1 hypothetical protein [Bdellovibrionales bacterium]